MDRNTILILKEYLDIIYQLNQFQYLKIKLIDQINYLSKFIIKQNYIYH